MQSEYLIGWAHDLDGLSGEIKIAAKSLLDAEDKFYKEFRDGYSITYIGAIYG